MTGAQDIGVEDMHDALGDRMKRQYEDRCRHMLPRRTHTIIRLDGKAFHTYTRGRERPWDQNFHHHLVNAAAELCQQAQGCLLGYVQSDEISVLLQDYSKITTEAWFDGNLQKIVSVSASIVTARFNTEEWGQPGTAHFDARAFTIPDPVEVHNYFVWRQKDAERNSLTLLAQASYSHRQLHGKNRDDKHDMLHAVGKNWNNEPAAFKRGTMITKEEDGWRAWAAPIFTQEQVVMNLLENLRDD